LAKPTVPWYNQLMQKNIEKDDKKLPILPISAVAKVLNVHQRTLRIYDEHGILIPKRSTTNKRLYTLEDVELGRYILFLTRNLGINIAGVKIILSLAKKDLGNIEEYIPCTKVIAGLSDKELDYNAKRLSARGRRPTAAV